MQPATTKWRGTTMENYVKEGLSQNLSAGFCLLQDTTETPEHGL